MVRRIDGNRGILQQLLRGEAGFDAGCDRHVAHLVADFAHGADHIDFAGVKNLSNFAQLAIANVGGNAVVWFAGDSVTLTGVAASSLDASDFVFH